MRTIVILSGIPYEYLKHRPQHFATYFVREGYEVLYICITDYNKINTEILKSIKNRNSFTKCFFEENDDKVFVIKNNIYEGDINNSSLTLLVNKINEIYYNDDPVYIVAFPEWITHLHSISENSKLIYDCLDDWEEFSKDPDMGYSETLIYKERKLASIADLVISSSKRLYVKMSYYNNNVYYLPNGVWSAEYVGNEYPNLPDDIKSIPRPIVFFMGAVAKWVDINLIHFIAKERPEYSFVFAGNVRCVLPDLPNIYFLGTKKYEELPEYLNHSSVCIIPFKVNNLTAAVTPLKLYEYLASSKPVVTTIMPDIIGLPGTRTAINYNDFIKYIDEYINMDDDKYILEAEMAKTSVRIFDWSQLLQPINEKIKKQNYQIKSNENFIKETIDQYKSFEKSILIKNELLGLYNLLGLYDLSCSLFDFNEIMDGHQQLDYEKLALAYLSEGKFEKSKKLLKIYIKNGNKQLLEQYINSLLIEDNKEILLKIYLMKISGDIYKAIKLADEELVVNQYQPKILGILSSLYLDIGEEDIAFKIALEVLAKENILEIQKIFDVNTLLFIIKSFSELAQYDFAEEIALNLMGIGEDWNQFFVSILSDIYISKHIVD